MEATFAEQAKVLTQAEPERMLTEHSLLQPRSQLGKEVSRRQQVEANLKREQASYEVAYSALREADGQIQRLEAKRVVSQSKLEESQEETRLQKNIIADIHRSLEVREKLHNRDEAMKRVNQGMIAETRLVAVRAQFDKYKTKRQEEHEAFRATMADRSSKLAQSHIQINQLCQVVIIVDSTLASCKDLC